MKVAVRPGAVAALIPWVGAAIAAAIQFARGLNSLTPVSDWAILVLRAREVGTSATPFTGAWSRYGWAHPGPVLQWALAIPVRLAGPVPGAMMTALAVNAAACWVIWRLAATTDLGRLIAGWVVLALVTLRPYAAVDFWNASVVVLPFAAFVVALGAVIRAEQPGRVAVSSVVLLGTWCAQSHAGCAPVVAVGWIAVTAVVARRRALVSALRSNSPAVMIGAAAWLLALGDVRNIGRLARFMVDPPDIPAQGVGRALKVMSEVGGGSLPWAVGRLDIFVVDVIPRWLPWSAVMFAIIMVVLVRRKDRAAWLLGTLWITQTFAVSSIRGPLLFWLVWPALALAASSLTFVSPHLPRREHGGPIGVVVIGVAMAITLAIGSDWWTEPDRNAPWQQTDIAELAEWTSRQVGSASPEVALRVDVNERGHQGTPLGGAVLALHLDGVDVRTDPTLELQYGSRRSWECGETLPSWWMIEPELVDRGPALERAGWMFVGHWTGVTSTSELWFHQSWDNCTQL